ncbi:protein kinase [Selenomonas sp. AB3002]|uniref:protein kinase domain-containing protein n=1 Tax=Selenomonas sp. AB3002 TaxID=1392502 RepID=UPI000497A6EB
MSERMQNLIGETIITIEGNKHRLEKMVGYGSQGIVYEDSTGAKMIKLYYPSGSKNIDEDILERLHFIREVKVPPNFVAIEDIVSEPYVGYVMEKVVDHKPLNSYLIPDQKIPFFEWYNKGLGLRERIFIGYIIAKAFGALERVNLSYCDISGNNILVKTGCKTASIKMIDTDNIYIAGKGAASVLGTPRYIAPEVINRQRNPDVLSDNYSLAVILFELLRVGHPYISDNILDGNPEDEEAALAGKCEYVTDDNSTNMLPADVVFTDKLKRLFRRCFVDGKTNRMMRPSAQEFEVALLEASNKVIKCPSCGAWYFPRKTGIAYDGCPWCDSISKPKARLNFYDVLTEGDDYRNGNIINGSPQGKLVNSYILRDGKNQIKRLYVLRYDNPSQTARVADNYLSIAKNDDGYWAYNEFSKSGVVIRKLRAGTYAVKTARGTSISKCKEHEYINLGNHEAVKIENGDCIYFELNVTIKIGGKKCSFIRMAKFLEEVQ